MLDLWSLCTLDYTHLVWALGNLSTARACWLWGEVGFPFPIFHDTRGEAGRNGPCLASETVCRPASPLHKRPAYYRFIFLTSIKIRRVSTSPFAQNVANSASLHLGFQDSISFRNR